MKKNENIIKKRLACLLMATMIAMTIFLPLGMSGPPIVLEINDATCPCGAIPKPNDPDYDEFIQQFWMDAWNHPFIENESEMELLEELEPDSYLVAEMHLENEEWVSGGQGTLEQTTIYPSEFSGLPPEQLEELGLISLDYYYIVGLFTSDVTQYTKWLWGGVWELVAEDPEIGLVIVLGPGGISDEEIIPPGRRTEENRGPRAELCPRVETLSIDVTWACTAHVDIQITNSSVTVGNGYLTGWTQTIGAWAEVDVIVSPPDNNGCVTVTLKARKCYGGGIRGIHIGKYCEPWIYKTETYCPCGA